MTETAWLIVRTVTETAPSSAKGHLSRLFETAAAAPIHAAKALAHSQYAPAAYALAVMLRYREFDRQAFLEAIRALDSDLAERCEAGDDIDSLALEWVLSGDQVAAALGNILAHAHSPVREAVIAKLAERGESSLLGAIISAFGSSNERSRMAAFGEAVKLAPDRRAEFAEHFLADESEDVARTAYELLTTLGPDVAVHSVIKRLPVAKSGTALLDLIAQEAPDRRSAALAAAARSRFWRVREKTAAVLTEKGGPEDLPVVRKLLRDRDEDVRCQALRALQQIDPGAVREAALEALDDKEWEARNQAVRSLADDEDPLLVEELLPRARDVDNDVRESAIRALAKYDDPRVLSELVSSLNDVHSNVREAAQQILAGSAGPVPVLRRVPTSPGELPIWQRIRDRVEAINRWASRVGHELLGKPVVVHQYRQSLGRTSTRTRRRSVDIEVSDTPVTTGHPHGAQIMRAIVLHEIGHHLCDIGIRGFSATRGIARSEGLGDVYDILLDERLERTLRSRRPQWGAYFDRLASYAFSQGMSRVPLGEYARLLDRSPDEVVRAVRRGDLPGRIMRSADGKLNVGLRQRDMLALPDLLPPLIAFLWCLRCGFDPALHPNPKVAEAIALIPSNLKDASHADVLEIARRIGDLIGRDKDHKQHMRRLRTALRRHGAALRELQQALERLANAGQLPDWMRNDAADIRWNPPAQTPQMPTPRPLKLPGGKGLNLGPSREYDRLVHEQEIPFDPQRHAQLAARIRKHVRRLRAYFERLGMRTVEQYASRRGRRVDIVQVRKAAVVTRTNLLVHAREEVHADAYMGLLIDCSGSMEGDKLELAKVFGEL